MIDNSIIEACLQNSAAAQRELYNKYSGYFFGICIRYANSREDAEDMLQEGFIKIFTSLHSFEFKGNFEGWMKRVIINSCINHLKKYEKLKLQISINETFEIEHKEESVASKLLGKQVMDSLLMLPVGFRTVINLYAIEGFSYKEIAKMLDVEESTCRSQFIRGKALLEQILMKKNIIPQATDRLEWLSLLNR